MTFALFIVYVVLSYIHPGEIVPALAPYHVTYWVGMAGLAVAMMSLLARRSDRLTNLQFPALMIFAAVMGVSLMVAERWLGAPVMAMQRFGPSMAMFVLASCSVTSLRRMRIAAAAVVVLTIIATLQGAAAYHLGYNARMFLIDRTTRGEVGAPAAEDPTALESVDSTDLVPDETAADEDGRDDVRIRGLGMMHDPNDLAMAMIVALGLIGGVWRAKLQLCHLFLAAAAGALVYGLWLTHSRGGAVALLAVIWRFAAKRVGPVPALVLLVALGAGTMALDFGGRSLSTVPDESASERLVAWTEGLEMLKAQPILGVGYGQFVDHHTLTAHNSLVLCFAETGLLGCFFWVGLLVVTLLELRGLRKLPGGEPFDILARQWAEGLQLSLIGFMAAAFFLSRTFAPTLYLILGLAGALAAIARSTGRLIALPALPGLTTLVVACELGGIGIVYAIVKLQFP